MASKQVNKVTTVVLLCYCLIFSVIVLQFTVRGCRPGKTVHMTEAEVRALCLKSREIFLSQPILLELEAPLKICGMVVQFNRMTSDTAADTGDMAFSFEHDFSSFFVKF